MTALRQEAGKMHGRFGVRSILGMVILFLILCVTIEIVATHDILTTATEQLTQSVIEDHIVMLESFDSTLATQLDVVRSQCMDILTVGAMNNIVIGDASGEDKTYEQVSNYSRVIEQLTTIMNQTELLRSASILFPSNGRLITNLTSYTVSQEEIQKMKAIVDENPDGSFSSPGGTGYWTCYPFYTVMAAHNASRIGIVYLSPTGLNAKVRDFCADLTSCDMAILYKGKRIAGTDFYQEHEQLLENANPANGQKGYAQVEIEGMEYLLIQTAQNRHGLSEQLIMPMEVAMSAMHRVERRIQIVNTIAVAVILVICILFCIMFYYPVFRLTRAMDQISGGNLSVRVKPHWSDDMGYLMQQFNHMSERLQSFVEKEYEYRLLVREAQMKQLQYQINPHFLYNTYFQMRNLIYLEDYENAEHLASLLGAYLKYIVTVKDGEAELGQEMEHAKNYAEIQAIRFHDRVSVETSIEGDDWEHFRVPCLLVQPLIENAFGHGLKNKEAAGIVRICLVSTEKSIDLSVEDNGSELSDAALEQLKREVCGDNLGDHEHIALNNIWNRVRIAFGGNSGLFLSRSPLGGLKAVIHMERGKESV